VLITLGDGEHLGGVPVELAREDRSLEAVVVQQHVSRGRAERPRVRVKRFVDGVPSGDPRERQRRRE
jgi:hypothetical protein